MDTLLLQKELAELLGWTNIKEIQGSFIGTPPDGGHGSRGQAMVPDWYGSWEACGLLMTAHDLDIGRASDSGGREVVYASAPDTGRQYVAVIGDYPDKDHATRSMIIRAVIGKLIQEGI